MENIGESSSIGCLTNCTSEIEAAKKKSGSMWPSLMESFWRDHLSKPVEGDPALSGSIVGGGRARPRKADVDRSAGGCSNPGPTTLTTYWQYSLLMA